MPIYTCPMHPEIERPEQGERPESSAPTPSLSCSIQSVSANALLVV